MENAEEVMQLLEEFSKVKPKEIPRELEDYLGYVAKTGDPVFQWSLVSMKVL
jgi:serine/threonine-protein phosphatase 4 regulatory subunit 2